MQEQTYNEFIQNILETRGRFGIPKDEYKERHHIIPRCIGGTNDEDNLIDLYAREHFIAHRLLYEENRDNHKIVSSFRMMCKCTSAINNDRRYIVDEIEYENVRKDFSYLHSSFMKDLTKEQKKRGVGIFSNESKEKTRAHLDKLRKEKPYLWKHTEEWNKHIGNGNRGKKYFNNGIENVWTYECPPGYKPGRIITWDESCRLSVIRKRQNKKVRCVDTGEIYDSIKEAQKLTGATHISEVCKGKLNKSGGLKWEYV